MFVLIFIMFVMCFLGFTLQSTFLKKRYLFAHALGSAIFLWYIYGYAIEESFTTLKVMLADSNIMYSFSIIITIEAVLGLFFNISRIGEAAKNKMVFLKYIPSPSFLISLYFFEVFIFLNFPGYDFNLFAIFIAILLSSIFVGLTIYMQKKDDESLALELKFIIHAIQIILAGFISVIYSTAGYVSRTSIVDYEPLVAIILFILPVIFIGFITRKYHIKKLSKKN